MKARLFVRLTGLALAALPGCQSFPYQPPPPVTAEMVHGKSKKGISRPMLEEGRTLLVHRCIECHTLPNISYYTAAQWPKLVDAMAKRSNLNAEQRRAIVAYILAARGE